MRFSYGGENKCWAHQHIFHWIFFNRNIDIKFPPNPEGSGGLVCLTPWCFHLQTPLLMWCFGGDVQWHPRSSVLVWHDFSPSSLLVSPNVVQQTLSELNMAFLQQRRFAWQSWLVFWIVCQKSACGWFMVEFPHSWMPPAVLTGTFRS